MLETYYSILFFIFGTIFGSFFNVVGYRLPKKESLLKPSSHCPKCNHKLSPLELIPIFSYIFLLGRCKKCKTKIEIFYPLIELITGILFLTTYKAFGFTPELVLSLIFISTSVITIVSDIKYMIIPDEIIIISVVSLFLVRILLCKDNITNILIDMLVPFLTMLLIKLLGDFAFKKESLGGGDIKLMLIFGLIIGWDMAILSIFIGSIIAFPISLYYYLKKKEHILPFGPYLCIAALFIHFLNINLEYVLNLLT